MEVISTYSRKQEIEDGVLHDVSEMAREAGIAHPVAITAAVWNPLRFGSACLHWPRRSGQALGHLVDVPRRSFYFEWVK